MVVIKKSRKKIAMGVRQQITGGDVIQVDEFSVDMNIVMPKKEVPVILEDIDETAMALRELKQKGWSKLRKRIWNILNNWRL